MDKRYEPQREVLNKLETALSGYICPLPVGFTALELATISIAISLKRIADKLDT